MQGLQMMFLALVLSLPFQSKAEVFNNAYLSFELPDQWKCHLEATEWICRHSAEKAGKEAIIIFAAKEAGPNDSFSIYEQVISSPRLVTDKSGKSAMSSVSIKAKQSKYNDHFWMDGLQKGSEIPNFFTRYLATIKEKVAVLITFSARAETYAKYSPDFNRAVQSLRVKASNNLTNRFAKSGSGSSQWSSNQSSTSPGADGPNGSAGSPMGFGGFLKSKNQGLSIILIGAGALLVVAGLFFMSKTRRR
jgi:hypothetical protein